MAREPLRGEPGHFFQLRPLLDLKVVPRSSTARGLRV
jgi:hypothetical protein